jgi:pyruvate/2-oxoglutarate dehydrogenase complex dihydrolipoamide dehydrogenase (E3) component
MKLTFDILIVGGGPAGVTAAVTAKKNYPAKSVVLIRKEEKAVIPCGIPYIFHRLDSVDKNIMSDQPLMDNKIDLVIGEVIEINQKEKTVILQNGDVCGYEKLVLALGSKPQPLAIPGIEKKGVWFVKKDYAYLKDFREAVLQSKQIVIIGGGFIGVEFADELSNISGLEISIIEKLNHCLITNFDQEFAEAAEEKLKSKGVKIFTDKIVKTIGGEQIVSYVELDSGEKISADLVILSIGSQLNMDLAEKSGIRVDNGHGIAVDEYLRTDSRDIFAAGDCAQTKDFITGKNISVSLASVAAAEARIAANNLYQIEFIRENKGTIGAFSTAIGGLTIGSVGLTEKRVQEENIDYIAGTAEAPNRHPAALPGMEKNKVKLIFSKSSENLLLGAEVMGSESAGEMLNILSLAIQQKISLFDFNVWQIATHPLLTAAPTVYPIIAAAQSVLFKLNQSSK